MPPEVEHSPSLREALEANYATEHGDAGAGTDTGTVDATVEADAPSSAGRDTSGRFAKAETAVAGAAATDEMPEGYSADLWAKLTPDARAGTAGWAKQQRETLAEREARLAGYEPIERVIGSRKDALTAQFGGVDRALEQLFHLSDWAGRDFPGFVRHLAQQRGIDLRTLLPAQQGAGQAPQQPDLQQLVRQAVTEQQTEAEVDRGFKEFEANASMEYRNHPGIRQVMAALIQGNAAADYTSAYKMATQAHPEIAPKLRAAEAATAVKADAVRRAEAAQAKASSAVSVTGAPGTARPSADAAPSTVREAIIRAMDNQAGARV